MGGNVFKEKTTSIKKENINSTLTAYFKELSQLFPKKAYIFNKKHFNPVGSAGKVAESGDIDLAINTSDVLDFTMSDSAIQDWGIDPALVNDEFNLLTKRARTATPEQLRMKAFLKTLAKHINNTAPTLHVEESKVSDGNLFGLYTQVDANGKDLGVGVQVDWMVGNLDWLEFSYYSSVYPDGSNVKGLHRTQLMLSAFQVANLSFNHINGIKDKETGNSVASNPKSALTILSDRLGFKIVFNDTKDFYQLHNLLKAKMSLSDYDKLLNVYFKILDSTRTDIPDNLQQEWIARKDKLSLTGKFLPPNSNLLR
jgi:hypothetical protein